MRSAGLGGRNARQPFPVGQIVLVLATKWINDDINGNIHFDYMQTAFSLFVRASVPYAMWRIFGSRNVQFVWCLAIYLARIATDFHLCDNLLRFSIWIFGTGESSPSCCAKALSIQRRDIWTDNHRVALQRNHGKYFINAISREIISRIGKIR